DELISELGLTGDVMAALRDMPIERLLEAQAAVTMRHEGFALRPVVDGTALPEPPLDAIAEGATKGVDVLAGTTRDEMTLLHMFNPKMGDLDDEKARRLIETVVGAGTGDLIATYERTRGALTPIELLTAAQTDAIFR